MTTLYINCEFCSFTMLVPMPCFCALDYDGNKIGQQYMVPDARDVVAEPMRVHLPDMCADVAPCQGCRVQRAAERLREWQDYHDAARTAEEEWRAGI